MTIVPGTIRSIVLASPPGAITRPYGGETGTVDITSHPGEVVLWLPQFAPVSLIVVHAIPGLLVGPAALSSNDRFDTPQEISQDSDPIEIDFSDALEDEPGEDQWWSGGIGYSKWFIWTATEMGQVRFRLNGPTQWDISVFADVWDSFEHMVREPDRVGQPPEDGGYWWYPAVADYWQTDSRDGFTVMPGQRFRLRIDDWSAVSGNPPTTNAMLFWEFEPTTTVFPNDLREMAIQITEPSGTMGPFAYDSGGPNTGDFIAGVTPNLAEQDEVFKRSGAAKHTTWWKWTASYNGPFEVSTWGSTSNDKYAWHGDPQEAMENGLDTSLLIFQTSPSYGVSMSQAVQVVVDPIPSLSADPDLNNNLLGGQDDGTGVFPYGYWNSSITFEAIYGYTYWIQVDYYAPGEAGDLYLNWGPAPAPAPGVMTDPGGQGSTGYVIMTAHPGLLIGPVVAEAAYLPGVVSLSTLTALPGTAYLGIRFPTAARMHLIAHGGFVSTGQADAGVFLEARAVTGAASLAIWWNGVALESSLSLGTDWATVGHKAFFDSDDSDHLRLIHVSGSNIEVRRIRVQDMDTYLYGAYPQGSDWPETAQNGGYARNYQVLLGPDTASLFTTGGFQDSPDGDGHVYFDRVPAAQPPVPATSEGGLPGRVHFIPQRS